MAEETDFSERREQVARRKRSRWVFSCEALGDLVPCGSLVLLEQERKRGGERVGEGARDKREVEQGPRSRKGEKGGMREDKGQELVRGDHEKTSGLFELRSRIDARVRGQTKNEVSLVRTWRKTARAKSGCERYKSGLLRRELLAHSCWGGGYITLQPTNTRKD
ncbi:hypothetical protein GQ53DRAFT_366640 [Thozetella sp. PMI_491]|nr:hypothetical protein GQ53DRAFT_366640 [Thozetella sp. PMI_491]